MATAGYILVQAELNCIINYANLTGLFSLASVSQQEACL